MIVVVQDPVCDFDLAGFVLSFMLHCLTPRIRVTIANYPGEVLFPPDGARCAGKNKF
jgi:hypothetical protein